MFQQETRNHQTLPNGDANDFVQGESFLTGRKASSKTSGAIENYKLQLKE
jgi:hypothetical protein